MPGWVAPSQKSEPLEDRAVTKALGVIDQRGIVTVGSFQVGAKAVRNMLNTAAQGRIVQYIDDDGSARPDPIQMAAPRPRIRYRSTSPMTTSMEPMIAGTSASKQFRAT